MRRVKVWHTVATNEDESNFYLDEFINRDLYNKYGGYCRRYINPALVDIAQLIRNKAGKGVVINNWASGGNFIDSGLRYYKTNKYGAGSVHLFGQAIDVKIYGMTGPQMFNDIVKPNIDEFMQLGLTTIEDTRFTSGWLHCSTEWTNLDELRIVKP